MTRRPLLTCSWIVLIRDICGLPLASQALTRLCARRLATGGILVVEHALGAYGERSISNIRPASARRSLRQPQARSPLPLNLLRYQICMKCEHPLVSQDFHTHRHSSSCQVAMLSSSDSTIARVKESCHSTLSHSNFKLSALMFVSLPHNSHNAVTLWRAISSIEKRRSPMEY